MVVSKTWSTGETLTASDLNTSFQEVEDRLGNITNSDLSDDAGITSKKLLDRYVVSSETIVIGGQLSHDNVTFGAGALWRFVATASPTTPVAGTPTANAIRFKKRVPSGKGCYLCAIDIVVHDYAASGADDGLIWVYKNTTMLGGAVFTITSGAVEQYLKNADPFASPLIDVQDGDFFEIQLGAEAAGTPTFGSIEVTFTYKTELVG